MKCRSCWVLTLLAKPDQRYVSIRTCELQMFVLYPSLSKIWQFVSWSIHSLVYWAQKLFDVFRNNCHWAQSWTISVLIWSKGDNWKHVLKIVMKHEQSKTMAQSEGDNLNQNYMWQTKFVTLICKNEWRINEEIMLLPLAPSVEWNQTLKTKLYKTNKEYIPSQWSLWVGNLIIGKGDPHRRHVQTRLADQMV